MIKKSFHYIFAVLVSVLFTLPAAAEQEAITVSAAISLKNAFEEIAPLFEARTKKKIYFNFGSSGDLGAQIKAGAPVDVFASASAKDMDALEDFIVKNTKVDFAANEIVLIQYASSKLRMRSFEDLQRNEIQKIAIGNPQSVPAGKYADEVLHSLNLFATVKEKLIFGENVRQVLDYVARNEVDAGIVYASDALSKSRDVVIVAKAPQNSHKRVIYPIALMKAAKNEKAARAFMALVCSPEGAKVLSKYGFKPLR